MELAAAHPAREPRGPHDPGGDRAPGPDPGRRGQPLHRAPPAPARRPGLRGPLRPPVARAGAARDARDDHLPGPGDRGRDGLRRLLAGRGRGAAPGDEPQALGGGDRGPPPAASSRARRPHARRRRGRWPSACSRWSSASRASASPRPTAPRSACSPTSRPGCASTTARSSCARCSTSSRWASTRPTRSSTRPSGAGSRCSPPDVNASEAECTVELRAVTRRRTARRVRRIGLGYVRGRARARRSRRSSRRARRAGRSARSPTSPRARARARPALDLLAWSGACDALARRLPREHARRLARCGSSASPRRRRAACAGRRRSSRCRSSCRRAPELRRARRRGRRCSPTTRRPA